MYVFVESKKDAFSPFMSPLAVSKISVNAFWKVPKNEKVLLPPFPLSGVACEIVEIKVDAHTRKIISARDAVVTKRIRLRTLTGFARIC